MAFDANTNEKRKRDGALRVAVVGSGVAGLSAAWLLSKDCDVAVYEKNSALGGHANTVFVPNAVGDATPVDAGFIVFNRPNYPNFTALLDHLDVPIDETCMSFAASMRGGAAEYAGHSIASVFARPASVASLSHWRMLRDIPRFHAAARAALAAGVDDNVSVADFVQSHGFSAPFVSDFLKPFAAAIWSTPSANVLDYPAASLFKFFANHGLLQVLNMPTWNTVHGGARAYVQKISAPFVARARMSTAVVAIERTATDVIVRDAAGGAARYDHVVIAAHADEALRMLANPTPREETLLGAFRYQPNRAFVHTDPALMPRRKRAWASWNYLGADDGVENSGADGAAVTYWMNRLQNLDCEQDVFVTLNPTKPIREDRIVAAFDYTHPMFDIAAGKAQKELWTLQGAGGVWFCGAHFGQGFHEDGLQAGLAVAEAISGARRPWSVENESARIYLPDHWPAAAAQKAAE